MELLKVINDYAQLINFVLFAAIVGWLVRITTISRTALTDKHKADLASKDIKIAQLEKTSEIFQLQLQSLEKDRDKLQSEMSEGKVDPHGLLAALEILKRKAEVEVEEAQKALRNVLSESQLKEKELENLRILNKNLSDKTNTLEGLQQYSLVLIGHRMIHTAHDIMHKANVLADLDVKLDKEKFDLYLSEIVESAKNLGQIFTKFPMFDKKSLAEPEFFDVSLQLAIGKILKKLQSQISAKEISLELLDLEKLPTIKGNSPTVEEIIFNVIANAINASDQKGKINIIGITKPNTVELLFQDFGKGMSKEALENAFRGFITSKSGHKGVGLLVAKQLTEYNKGHISVSSSKKATEIKLELPRN